jgi:2-keto-4-pentenoate hydratase/2-oxohepta-3-ene-1,7-dioic acid hydratase in catechol pathway
LPVGDFKDLANINFKLEVDGQLKQQGNTSLMLFPFDVIISYLSRFFTLRTGDLIFTGTPKGVGPVVVGNKLSAYIENEKLLEFEVK